MMIHINVNFLSLLFENLCCSIRTYCYICNVFSMQTLIYGFILWKLCSAIYLKFQNVVHFSKFITYVHLSKLQLCALNVHRNSIQCVLHGYIIRKIPHKFSHKWTVTTYPQIVCFFKKRLGRIFYMRCLNVRFQVWPFTLTFWRIQILFEKYT